MKNNDYNSRAIKCICETKLGVDFAARSRRSKEYNGWVYVKGVKAARITVPKGRKFVRPGTYGNMAKQLRITIPEFDDLLDCPLDGDEVKLLIDARPSPFGRG